MYKLSRKVKIKLVVAALVVTAIAVAVSYVDYTIYKAKYPNTTFMMYVLDSHK
jgi:hypothetical protein